MCVKNNMVELQVFDENDKEESSVPEPIANVGWVYLASTFNLTTIIFLNKHMQIGG